MKRITRKTKQLTQNTDFDDRKPPALTALNHEQACLIKALSRSQLVLCMAGAGTGKTYVSVVHAADRLRSRQIDKIIITRATVPLGRSIGYVPGTVAEKMAGWAAPALDAIRRRIGKCALDIALKSEQIELVPFETMRGRSFENAICIVDEAQNCTIDELKCLTTRIGEGSQLIIIGDPSQTDLRNSGLPIVAGMIEDDSELGVVVRLTEVVRSNLCAAWIRAWNNRL